MNLDQQIIPASQYSQQKQSMIDAQARLITKLNYEIDSNRISIAKLERRIESLSVTAGYYELIQKSIEDDDMLQDAWCQFITTLKLRTTKAIPGLTSSEN